MELNINHAPWMIEEAYTYSQASLLLRNQIMSVAEVNAALSLEILFKSFFAIPAENIGSLGERYEVDWNLASHIENLSDRHNLLKLAKSLPLEIRKALRIDGELMRLLCQHQQTFVLGRYKYEKRNRVKVGHSTFLVDLSKELVGKVVKIYKDTGCDDPFIINYPNVFPMI